ncbi:MAG: alpha/beta hydrolase-fold protein [Candidatus Cybelea sp.]
MLRRNRYFGVRVLLAALPAAALMLSGADASDVGATLRSVADQYYSNVAQVATVAGRETTMDYYERLVNDAALLLEPAPNDYPPEIWRQTAKAASELDVSLAVQLMHRSYQPMAAIRGLGETLLRSSKDGTMQPIAVYVPASYSPQRPAPLVIFLHGHQQAESHLLAPPYVRDLAERTGTIVVAPYGRGAYDFAGSESDVYDAFGAANAAFAIDPHRRYLAGYSMGGFSVFRLAPLHPDDWTAVMSIAGSLLVSRAPPVTAALSRTRFYILTGARDDNVPTAYPTATAIFLRDAGLAVTFYSQPGGTHSLYSLRPILSQAWDEMERGIVRSPEGLTGPPNLPEEIN